MKKYTIYCTKEQTERAERLGAPIETDFDVTGYITPTAEQMCGWLREEKKCMCLVGGSLTGEMYIKAMYAAIDAALDKLESEQSNE